MMNKIDNNKNQQVKALIEGRENLADAGMTNALIAQHALDLIKTDAQHVSMIAANRLAQSRQLAVNRLASLQQVSAINQSGNVLQWLGDHVTTQFMQHRAISAAFAIVLFTFFAVQQFGLNDNIENGDAYLLASDLPPEAFADKGFDTWLVSVRD